MIRLSGGEQRRVELRDGAGESVRADGAERGAVSLASGRSGSVTPGRGFAQEIALETKGRAFIPPSPKMKTMIAKGGNGVYHTYTSRRKSERSHADITVSLTIPTNANILDIAAPMYNAGNLWIPGPDAWITPIVGYQGEAQYANVTTEDTDEGIVITASTVGDTRFDFVRAFLDMELEQGNYQTAIYLEVVYEIAE